MSINVSASKNSLSLRISSSNRITANSTTTSERTATSSTGPADANWHHACAVFTTTSSRAAYYDGANKGTNTSSNTATGFNNTCIAVRHYNGAYDYHLNGDIGEAAIWNVALTDSEVASLALGFSPLMIRPMSLVGYWPMVTGPTSGSYLDRVARNNMTITGTPSISTHVNKILYPFNVMSGISVKAFQPAWYASNIASNCGFGGALVS